MIRFPCANLNCQYHLKAKESKVGKKGKCPLCGLVQTIPKIEDLEHVASGLSLDDLPAMLNGDDRVAVAEVTRKCLVCGKLVDPTAMKCNHCGEWFDRQDVLAELRCAEPAATSTPRKSASRSRRSKKREHKNRSRRAPWEGPLPPEDQYDGPIDLTSPAAIGLIVALLAVIGVCVYLFVF